MMKGPIGYDVQIFFRVSEFEYAALRAEENRPRIGPSEVNPEFLLSFFFFFFQVKCRIPVQRAASVSRFSSLITNTYCIILTRNRTLAQSVDVRSKNYQPYTTTSVSIQGKNLGPVKPVVSSLVPHSRSSSFMLLNASIGTE